MSTQKFVNRGVRKITKVGQTSLAVTLPKDMLYALGWKEKQKVKLSRVHGGILIKDWKK
ncbi:MAG TPA: AbrB/MazE/SpoVT family DNA-binding domain-containing protein [Candidatus Paceibacterota bacterium]